MESSYQVKKTEGGIPEILIYGVIGGWDIDDVTASSFVREFKALEQQHDRINVRINSPGGSLWEGLAIYNTLLQSQKDIHTYVDGIAYSMAGIIALAGKTVHAPKSSMLMIHNASGIVVGNAQTMRTAADELDKYDTTIAETIAARTGQDVQEIVGLWLNHKDHYFTAQEALDLKLIDIIEEQAAPAPVPAGVSNMSFSERLNYYSKGNPQNSPGFISSLKSLFKPQASLAQQAPSDRKVYSQAEFEKQVEAVESKYQGRLFEAENNAEFWKQKAEEYGSQPGAMPTNPRAATSELSGEENDGPKEPKHLYLEAHAVTRFRPGA